MVDKPITQEEVREVSKVVGQIAGMLDAAGTSAERACELIAVLEKKDMISVGRPLEHAPKSAVLFWRLIMATKPTQVLDLVTVLYHSAGQHDVPALWHLPLLLPTILPATNCLSHFPEKACTDAALLVFKMLHMLWTDCCGDEILSHTPNHGSYLSAGLLSLIRGHMEPLTALASARPNAVYAAHVQANREIPDYSTMYEAYGQVFASYEIGLAQSAPIQNLLKQTDIIYQTLCLMLGVTTGRIRAMNHPKWDRITALPTITERIRKLEMEIYSLDDYINKNAEDYIRSSKQWKHYAIMNKVPCSVCATYPAAEKVISVCKNCTLQPYCSQECQVADWPTHKLHCSKIAKLK